MVEEHGVLQRLSQLEAHEMRLRRLIVAEHHGVEPMRLLRIGWNFVGLATAVIDVEPVLFWVYIALCPNSSSILAAFGWAAVSDSRAGDTGLEVL